MFNFKQKCHSQFTVKKRISLFTFLLSWVTRAWGRLRLTTWQTKTHFRSYNNLARGFLSNWHFTNQVNLSGHLKEYKEGTLSTPSRSSDVHECFLYRRKNLLSQPDYCQNHLRFFKTLIGKQFCFLFTNNWKL